MAPQKYYTVGVSNKFAAFGADSDASSDEGEVILSSPPPIATEQQQQQQGAAASKKKEQQLQQQVSPQRERHGRAPRSTRAGFGEGRGAYRGSRGRPEVTAEASEEVYGAQLSAQDGEGGHRRRGGIRGRRGGPPGAGGPPFPRREFDRHSATGRGRETKKQGAGGHNWGQEESENHPVKSEVVLAEDVASKEQISQDAQTAEEGEVKEVAPAPQDEVEEEEPTIDLDTYKKMQAEKRANLPTFVPASASSKPIETDKELAAQGYVRLERGGDADTEGAPEESPETREDRPKKKSINLYEYVHIEGGRVPSFSRRGPRGGGRGGARDDRPRRGGAGPRAPRSREVAPDLKDTQAFPTLGAR